MNLFRDLITVALGIMAFAVIGCVTCVALKLTWIFLFA